MKYNSISNELDAIHAALQKAFVLEVNATSMNTAKNQRYSF